MRKFDSHGIEFKVPNGPIVKAPELHDIFADMMEKACHFAANHGIVKIGTFGFVNCRAIRGRENKCSIGQLLPVRYTSRHSEGEIKKTGLASWKLSGPWPDGITGSCALDIACDGAGNPRLYTADNMILWDRKQVVTWFQMMGFGVEHRTKGSIAPPDHIHVEYRLIL